MTKLFSTIVTFSILVLLTSCGKSISEEYRLDKPYWDLKDYEHAAYVAEYGEDEFRLPEYGDPEKAEVFKKFTDKNNVDVVVKDESLGLTHKYDFADGLFSVYRDLLDEYAAIDREDNFVTGREFVELMQFGLYVQIHYFELGNERIRKNADDPDSPSVKRNTRENIQTMIGNFNIYLNYVKNESQFGSETISIYADGIDEYFSLLIQRYPDSNYGGMKRKASDMLEIAESEKLKSSLQSLITLISPNETAEETL